MASAEADDAPRAAQLLQLYAAARGGAWERVLAELRADAALAALAARVFAHPLTGFTFLHAAAAAGHEGACRFLVSRGASLHAAARARSHAADADAALLTPVEACAPTNDNLRDALRRAAAASDERGCFRPPGADAPPKLRTPSHAWGEATPKVARRSFCVLYAGASCPVRAGQTYYADAWGRVLVGWHGTVCPPCGMDGEPMVGVQS
jgi:hypothetical protein